MGNKKARVFAAYQIGEGINAKMVGDEALNKFVVTFGTTSEMVHEIEGILAERYAEEIKNRRNYRSVNKKMCGPVVIGIDQLEGILKGRFLEAEGRSPIIVIHHFQLIGFVKEENE